MKEYQTLLQPGEASYEIQKSRFLAHARSVETEAEAQAFIQQMKKKYFDARHNCSAWVLGDTGSLQKSNDDGEPGGTAGNPILEAIKKNSLTNTVIVVTRYFGGIKLGAGGLIRAYSHTAALGIDSSGIQRMAAFRRTAVTIGYPLLGTLENELRRREIRIADKAFAADVTLVLLLPKDTADSICSALVELTAGRCHLDEQGEEYLGLPICQPQQGQSD